MFDKVKDLAKKSAEGAKKLTDEALE